VCKHVVVLKPARYKKGRKGRRIGGLEDILDI